MQGRVPRTAVALTAVVAIGWPFAGSLAHTPEFGRPTTAGRAHEWFLANVRPGARVIVEDGVLRLPARYPVRHAKSLGKPSFNMSWLDEADYVIAGGSTYEVVLTDPARDPEMTVQYRRILGSAEEVAAFDPSPDVGGPRLRIYRLRR